MEVNSRLSWGSRALLVLFLYIILYICNVRRLCTFWVQLRIFCFIPAYGFLDSGIPILIPIPIRRTDKTVIVPVDM